MLGDTVEKMNNMHEKTENFKKDMETKRGSKMELLEILKQNIRDKELF